MTRRKTIAFFIAALSTGGAERQTLQLRQHFLDLGHRVPLFVYGGEIHEILKKQAADPDIHLLKISGKPSLNELLAMKRKFSNVEPDVLITINMTTHILAATLKTMLGLSAPLVNIFHSTILDKGNGLRLVAYKWALKKTAEMIFVSEMQLNYWKLRGVVARHTAAIHNGLDFEHFQPNPTLRKQTRAALNLRENTVLISLVAGFRPEKNHQQLVRILPKLRSLGHDVRFMFVGDGQTMPDIQRQCETLGMIEFVTFAGNQSDVRPFISASDIGVLCSFTEAFSLSAIEFLGCGVPMVMSETGGAVEIVENGKNGYLFKVDDDAEALQCFVKLLDVTHRSKLASNARQSIAHYSLENMFKKYDHILDRVMADHLPSGS